MLGPTAWQSTIGLSVGLLGWLMTSPLLTAQTALQTQGQSKPALRAAATAFRVETDIYLKVNNAKPDKQTLTLFKEGVYYDFPMDYDQQSLDKQTITMTDPLNGRIVVLRPSAQIKTVFKTAELSSRVEALKKDMASNKELAKLLNQQATFNETTKALRVGDESFAYEATLQPARDASIAAQYADFADWSARLNALLPPNFPPFVRFELNREVAARGALPDTIVRTTRHNGNSAVIRSKLLVNAVLSSDDEAKIRMVGELLARCKEVPQTEFFGPVETARNNNPRAATR